MGGGRTINGARTLTINLVAYGRFDNVTNVWGDRNKIPSHTHLFLTLRRVNTRGNNRLGHYVLEPTASKFKDYVSDFDYSYTDVAGNRINPTSIYIGRMELPSVKKMDERVRLSAAGVSPGSDAQAMESAAHLPKDRIYIGGA